VLAAVKKSDPTSAGGPSGLTLGHLYDALLNKEDLRTALARLFTSLANGALPLELVRTLLGGCRLIPLAKGTAGDVRPIAVGEILRRLCGRILLGKFSDAARARLEPLQVGVGTRSGGEACVHSAQLYLDLHPDHVVVNTDLTAAFQNMSRVAIFEELLADPDLNSLAPFLRGFYLGEGSLYVKVPGEPLHPLEILSKSGAQQGCTFGTLLWSLGWHKALVRAAEISGVAVSFVDDGFYGLQAADVPALLAAIDEEAARRGGKLNYSKSLVYSRSSVLPAGVRGLGVRCVDLLTAPEDRGFVINGAPVGTPEFVDGWLASYVDTQRVALDRLREIVPEIKCVLQMIVYCLQPRIGHLLRCLPPEAVASHAAALDTVLQNAFLQTALPGLAAADISASAVRKLALKLRDGGLCPALAPACPAAFLASVYDTRQLLLRINPEATALLPTAAALLAPPASPPPSSRASTPSNRFTTRTLPTSGRCSLKSSG
jgi:hypothetical protein